MEQYVIDVREDTKTYDLSTARGAITPAIQVLVVLAILVWGIKNFEDWKGLAATVFGATALAAWLIPAWVFWVLRNVAGVKTSNAQAGVITERTKMLELETELKKLDLQYASELKTLRPEQLAYLEKLGKVPHMRIGSGETIVWYIGGLEVPLWFADLWWSKYEGRGADVQLPSQDDFNYEKNRDQCREWCLAITSELVRTGLVRHAGGPFPPRWVTKDTRQRDAALHGISVYLALELYRLEWQEGSDEQGEDDERSE